MTSVLARNGIEVTVASTALTELRGNLHKDNPCFMQFKRNLRGYKISFTLKEWLEEHVRDFDLLHVHALFSFSSTVAVRAARRRRVPYIIRPLGVLNRWGMENRRPLLKSISFRLIELPMLLNSAAIHYTSQAERAEAESLNSRLGERQAKIIPLPVQPQAKGKAERFFERYPQLCGRKVILFLSRLDPKKRIELLIDAIAEFRSNRIALVVAGDGNDDYVRQVHAHAQARGIEDRIVWAGHVSGEDKAASFSAADVFVLPSASENFGIAAAEALAAGLPTIISEEVGISGDVLEYDAGIVVQTEVQQLAHAMEMLLTNKDKADRIAANGERLARERYSPEAVGKALQEMYVEVLNDRPAQAR